MLKKIKNYVAGLLAILLAFAGVVASEAPSQALNANTFDPGLIISDSVFYDWGSMNADQIQKFLNARVPVCTDNDGGPKCLRNYKEDVVGSYAIRGSLHSYSLNVCAEVPAASDRTAAQIISSVATACKINPRVLLVTLQKEQGLVGSADPTTYMYKAAMGYGCPDSAPQICGQDSNSKSRLFWQLYRAAWQLRWYGDPRGSFTYLKPGTTISMGYNPKTSCGRQSFKLKSQATAKLYYYTPYVPNASGLRNLWGTGDSCSAYGNRNFWRQYWTWFGSPVAGGYLLKAPSTQTYLVNQDSSKRYLITDESMVSDFKPLGPLGTVSDAYMGSFTDAGPLKPLVSDAAGNRYLIASGLKYKITTSTQAAALGLDWVTAPVLTDVQISSFGDMAFAKSPTTEEVFLLQGSTRALLQDQELLKTLSTLGATGVMQETVLNGFTLTSPVTELVQDSSGNRFDLESGLKVPVATASLATSLGHSWASATTIATLQLSKIATASFLKSSAGTSYLLSGTTKHLVSSTLLTSIPKFGSTATVSADYLSKFATGTALTPLMKVDAQNWYVSAGQKFPVTNSQASAMGLDITKSVNISAAQLATLSSPILMKTSSSATTYLVDDFINKHPLTTSDLETYKLLGPVGVVPNEYLNSFSTKTNPARMVNGSDGNHYYLIAGKRYKISNVQSAKAISPSTFGSANDFSALPTLTSVQLSGYPVSTSTKLVTQYVSGTEGNYYIENGQRREILDSASLAATMSPLPNVSVISSVYFKDYPVGQPIIGDNNLFKNSSTGAYGVNVAGTYYPVEAKLFEEVKASNAWNFTKSTGTLSSASVAKFTQGVTLRSFVSSGANGYLLTAAGKRPITDIANVTATPAAVPVSVLDRIALEAVPTVATPFIVKASATSKTSYLVSKKVKQPILDSAEVTSLQPLVSSTVVQIWPQSAIDQLKTSTKVLAPGSVVSVKESKNIYLIDGWARGLRISSTTAKAFGVPKPKVVTRADLTGYNTLGSLTWQTVICDSKTYLVDERRMLLIDANSVNQWPGKAVSLAQSTCQNLNPGTLRVGTLVANGANKYKVIGGKLKLIRTAEEYTALSNGQTSAAVVSAALIASLPKLNPTSYSVVRGDSLAKVSAKFKTTNAVLRKLNSLRTDTLRVGQVLKLP